MMMSNYFLLQKFKRLHVPILVVVALLCAGGLGLLYDAGGGNWARYAEPQSVKMALGLGMMMVVALVRLHIIFALAYPIYAVSILLLVAVFFVGHEGMGAQRWLNLGGFILQPSEVAKVAVVLALARFYQTCPPLMVNFVPRLAVAMGIILLPFSLTLIQPDLGTAGIILVLGVCTLFLAGVSLRLFFWGAVVGLATIPVAWFFVLKNYQKQRVLTFLNPENDPLGAGYHIIQSKIAIGSSGFFGKGFLQGSQSQLLFLPEKHTDFIFSLLTEDFGMLGALLLLVGYTTLITLILRVVLVVHNTFSALVVAGVGLFIFLHAGINMAMVMGLVPVVGVPLPFISYGGSATWALLLGIGLVLNAHIYRDVLLPGEGIAGRRF